MKYLFFAFLFLSSLFAQVKSIDITPSNVHKDALGIKILDQKELTYSKIDGKAFSEISDLAYDPRDQKLYMVSDEGKLFIFRATFAEKITEMKPLSAATVRKKSGKKFRKWQCDTEGLCFGSKGGLLISFEGDAKLGLFGEDGRRIKKYKLPRVLRNPDNYRSRNKSLEALALHPRYGALLVAEWPLKRDHKKHQTIYSLSGRKWHFKAEGERKSAVTAIEVMDDGSVLVLERSFISYFDPLVITLKKVYLNGCQNRVCKSKVLAKLSSHKGWDVDNFEGLAKVGKHRYVMISDDNDNFLQKTLLIYFEVLE